MNETVQAVSALISTVGFPVFACIVLFRQNDKQSQTISAFTKSIDRLTNSINAVIQKISDTNNNKKGE